ncbi:hypothetical protein RYX36_003695 [Vicia faba]
MDDSKDSEAYRSEYKLRKVIISEILCLQRKNGELQREWRLRVKVEDDGGRDEVKAKRVLRFWQQHGSRHGCSLVRVAMLGGNMKAHGDDESMKIKVK